jgi:hypothetical protein
VDSAAVAAGEAIAPPISHLPLGVFESHQHVIRDARRLVQPHLAHLCDGIPRAALLLADLPRASRRRRVGARLVRGVVGATVGGAHRTLAIDPWSHEHWCKKKRLGQLARPSSSGARPRSSGTRRLAPPNILDADQSLGSERHRRTQFRSLRQRKMRDRMGRREEPGRQVVFTAQFRSVGGRRSRRPSGISRLSHLALLRSCLL